MSADVPFPRDFGLKCDLQTFVRLYWEGEEQHVDFLTTKLGETGIEITKWKMADRGWPTREVKALHPLPIQLPWLPLHITNRCKQTLTFTAAKPNELKVVERSAVNGIPFVQPYLIVTWTIIAKQEPTASLDITVDIAFEYDVYTLLKSQVEFFATAAMIKYFDEWVPHATSLIPLNAADAGADEEQGPIVRVFWPRTAAAAAAGGDVAVSAGAGTCAGAASSSSSTSPLRKVVSAKEIMKPTSPQPPGAAEAEEAAATTDIKRVDLLEGVYNFVLRLGFGQKTKVEVDDDEVDDGDETPATPSAPLGKETIDNAQKLSSTRPFKGRVLSPDNLASDSMDSVAAGGAESHSMSPAEREKRRAARRRNKSVQRKGHTPETTGSSGFACVLPNLKELFPPPRRPSISETAPRR